MSDKIKIGISSCLLGNPVRYDGGHKLDHALRDALGHYGEWVPVCPEVESGLPVPREAMRLAGDPKAPRLITVETGIDHTDRLVTWAQKKARLLEREKLCGFIFKSRSPSCAVVDAELFASSGTLLGKSAGIFARVFIERFPLIPVDDDGRLQNPGIRENFLKRVLAYKRMLES